MVRGIRLERFANRSPRWLLHVLQTVVGMGAYQIFAFLAGILIARALGPSGQGRFQLVLSITIFLTAFVKMGLDEGLTYFIPRYRLQRPQALFSIITYSLTAVGLISVFLGGAIWLLSGWLGNVLFQLEGVADDLKYVAVLLPTSTIMLLGLAILRGLERADLRAYIYYYAVSVSFLAGIAILLLWKGALTITETFTVRALSFALGGGLSLFFVFRAVKPAPYRLSFPEIRSLHTFGGLLIFISMFQYVVEQPLIDLAIVARVGSSDDVGIYSVATRIAVLVAIIPNALIIVLAPAISDLVAKKDFHGLQERYTFVSEWMARLSLFVAIGLMLMRNEMLGIFGTEYSDGALLLVILLVGQATVGIMGLNTPLLLASGYARIEFGLTLVFAVLMVIGGLVLGSLFGVVGVAVSTASTTGLMSFARYMICKRMFPVKIRNGLKLGVVLVSAVSGSLALLAGQAIPHIGFLDITIEVGIFTAMYWGLTRQLETTPLFQVAK